MFSYNSVSEYQVEITSKCNASCPQCPRNINGGKVNPHMPLTSISRDVMDRTFTPELVARLRQVFFCGSYGDPIVHPEFLRILSDLRAKRHDLWLYIHTNGGMHESGWWAELATILNGKGKVDFGFDGLADTLHLYRKGVDFTKAVANAKAFIDAGGNAQWNFIVFEHNQHQVEAAESLSKELGFQSFLARKTGRFLDHKDMVEFDGWPVKGEYIIRPPTISKWKNDSMSRLSCATDEYFQTTEIKCDALMGNKVAISAAGLVLPCNFFTHNLYDARFYNTDVLPRANAKSFVNGKNAVREFIEKYGENALSIHHHSLEEIFDSPFWADLVASWTNENRLFECALTCGSKITKVWDQNK